MHIVQTAKKVEADNSAHTQYQEELIAEINDLKQQLEDSNKSRHQLELRKDQEIKEVRR